MESYYLKVGTLIDGNGIPAQINSSIRVVDGRITAIGSLPEENDIVVDYSKYTVLPGLINCHVHVDMVPVGDPIGNLVSSPITQVVLEAAKNMEYTLKTGITYVRNMGSMDYLDMQLDTAIKKGLIQGPGIVTCGHLISMTGGHGHQIAYESDGSDECRKNARKLLKAGVDHIKTIATGGVMTKGVDPGSPQLTYEELKAIVEEAHKAGKKVSSHAQGTEGIKNAVLAGVDSIEHAIFLSDEVIDLMVQRGTYVVPTFVAPWLIVKNGEAAGIPKHAVDKALAVSGSHVDSIRKAHSAGVKIAMGTDSGTPCNPHGLAWEEFKFMMDAGMTAMETIVAATKTAAELLGIDKLRGTLEIGKAADILVVDGDPLKDISNLARTVAVWKEGGIVPSSSKKIDSLDRLN